MHGRNIIHRDLKLSNIMINPTNFDVKILDFGLSRDFTCQNINLQSIVGTPLFVAPEMLTENLYSEKCDLWSSGVLMYYLLSGDFAFNATNITNLYSEICKGVYSFTKTIWNDISLNAKNLIK